MLGETQALTRNYPGIDPPMTSGASTTAAYLRPLLLALSAVLMLIAGPIQAGRTITLTTVPYPPYYGPELPQGGIVTQLVTEALQHQGYSLEVKWLPWARALGMARQGLYDGAMGAWYTEERAQDFSYSVPFMRNDLVLFKHRGETIHYRRLEDLKTYRVGVTIGSGLHELLTEEFADHLVLVADGESGLKQLMARRFDLLADEKESILYLVATRYPGWHGAIEALEPPLQVNALHLIISRNIPDHRQITEAFNRGFEQLIEEGRFATLLHQHGFTDSHHDPLPAPAAANEPVDVPAPSPPE